MTTFRVVKMTSHLDCALLSARVYKEWDHVTAGMEVLFSDDKKTIAFAGTNIKQPMDVLRDVRIFPLWSPKLGLCPAGFLKASRRLGYVVLDHMAEHDLESITLTGHSLGGACALITAALILRETDDKDKIRQVVTFGAPRVGKLRALTRPTSQYRFQNDIVPTVPWPLSRPSGLLPLGEQGTRGNWISDHSIINYINALRAR
tara:strand:+ start:201 stop:809 length:609 start_codon:yes stop_codon:yes gene_type:complete